MSLFFFLSLGVTISGILLYSIRNPPIGVGQILEEYEKIDEDTSSNEEKPDDEIEVLPLDD